MFLNDKDLLKLLRPPVKPAARETSEGAATTKAGTLAMNNEPSANLVVTFLLFFVLPVTLLYLFYPRYWVTG